jgi:glycosyltransferase involved in cell wall biosynthesis
MVRPPVLSEPAGRPALRVDYLAPIPRDGISGRSKASSEKAAAMERVAPGSRTYLLRRECQGRPLRQLAGMVGLEARYLADALLTTSRPDAIITRSPIALGALLAARILGVPLIKEIHTDIADETPVAFAGRRIRQIGFGVLHRADIWFARRADGIIFNNTALETHFREKYLDYGAVTTTIPNGTDTATFRRLDLQACRRELGLEPDRRYLVWVGAINRWHGVEQVVRLAEMLPPDYEVLVVGKATSEYARQLISGSQGGQARFVGAVTPRVAAHYINAADACLLPVAKVRVSPGSPLKLYDYAACGTPIIAQRETEGYSDVVLAHGIGIVVDFADPAGATRDIRAYVPHAGQVRDQIRRVAEERFSWERRMAAWLEFVARVSDGRRGHG